MIYTHRIYARTAPTHHIFKHITSDKNVALARPETFTPSKYTSLLQKSPTNETLILQKRPKLSGAYKDLHSFFMPITSAVSSRTVVHVFVAESPQSLGSHDTVISPIS